MTAEPPAAPEHGAEDAADLRVVALLGCAAVFAAVVGAYSAILADRGSDRWHEAIRSDIRQGARIVSDARLLYEEDAPVAHRVAAYELRAQELAEEAASSTDEQRSILEAEARAQRETADVLAQGSELAAGSARGATRLSGDDLLERFAEIRAALPAELRALDPDRVESEGDSDQVEASSLIATTIAAGLALMLGALAEAVPRRRRGFTDAGFGVLGVGVIAALLVLFA